MAGRLVPPAGRFPEQNVIVSRLPIGWKWLVLTPAYAGSTSTSAGRPTSLSCLGCHPNVLHALATLPGRWHLTIGRIKSVLRSRRWQASRTLGSHIRKSSLGLGSPKVHLTELRLSQHPFVRLIGLGAAPRWRGGGGAVQRPRTGRIRYPYGRPVGVSASRASDGTAQGAAESRPARDRPPSGAPSLDAAGTAPTPSNSSERSW